MVRAIRNTGGRWEGGLVGGSDSQWWSGGGLNMNIMIIACHHIMRSRGRILLELIPLLGNGLRMKKNVSDCLPVVHPYGDRNSPSTQESHL